MKILVTGADGFIGSHLVEHLVHSGHSVRALTQYNSFGTHGWLDTISREIWNEVEVVTGDVRDSFGVRSAVSGCEAVCHLAALIAIPYSYVNPMSYVDTNVVGTLNVLQACRDCNVGRLVHTSTSEVYGSAQYVPIDESHPLHAQSPYAATKVAADQLAYSYYSSFDLDVVTIRPFNTYGPRQSLRAVIPTIITQVARGASQLDLGASNTTRDFNYYADTVRGFGLAVITPGLAGQTINLASNFEVEISDVVRIVSRIVGRDVELRFDDTRSRPAKSEVVRLWGANDKAKQMLDWQPIYGGLDGFSRGLHETYTWFTEVENLARYSTKSYSL
jgi:NAD dependent epimerase/dehydratase